MVGINQSTNVVAAGSKPIISGTPFIVGLAKRISEEYSNALMLALEVSAKKATSNIQESAKKSDTQWADISDSLEAWYQFDTESLHLGVRNGAENAALAMKLEYGDAEVNAPNPLLRSTALTYKDTFAKDVSNTLDKVLSKGIK